jgi:hypothetical protein
MRKILAITFVVVGCLGMLTCISTQNTFAPSLSECGDLYPNNILLTSDDFDCNCFQYWTIENLAEYNLPVIREGRISDKYQDDIRAEEYIHRTAKFTAFKETCDATNDF